MRDHSRPGAFIEWHDATTGGIAPLRTDVAAFVGIARCGPLDTPVPVESFRQFEAHFGTFTGSAYLAYAVRGFFENGGRRCWVVRVASPRGARPWAFSSVDVADSSGAPAWRLGASSPGRWGDSLSASLAATFPAQTVAAPPWTSDRYATVESCAGFQRADLVRISQPGLPAPLWRVVSFVDTVARRLYWVHPEPGAGLPYDRTLSGIDANQPAQVASLAYALTVRLAGLPATFTPGLTLVPEHPRYGPSVLRRPPDPLSPDSAGTLPRPAPPVVIERVSAGDPLPLAVVQGALLPLRGGGDGLVDLAVEDFLGEPAASGDDDETARRKRRGLRALDAVDEVAIVSVPDILIQPQPAPSYALPEAPPANPCLPCPPPAPPAQVQQPPGEPDLPPVFSDDDIYQVQAALVQHCEERRDRFALLDPPAHTVADGARGLAEVQAWRARFDSRYAALYYPWLRVADPMALAPTRLVPACGHVAGQFAWHDWQVGVHRAPANRVLSWVQDVGASVDDALHGELNEAGVNVVRAEPGRGLRILGARTVSSDPDWIHLNVRRLFMMLMKALDVGTQWAAFEPNDQHTRARVALSIGEFLAALWRRGALVGTAPAEAFYVRCDDSNNPPAARAEGRLLAEVGVAPSRPCEFVVLRAFREGNSFELVESDTRNGVAA